MDLNNTHLFMRMRIVNTYGTHRTNADVGFINYPGCAILTQVDMTLGDRLITQSLAIQWDN